MLKLSFKNCKTKLLNEHYKLQVAVRWQSKTFCGNIACRTYLARLVKAD